MSTLAIIGTGIAGLGCAHFLQHAFDLTLFERDDHVGGHANTVEVREPDTARDLPVDTGFMVFNRTTYPHLCRLFEGLGVPVKRTDMSFSVRDDANDLEWCGSSLNHLFAQRRNLLRPRFLKMLWQVDRFNREAVTALNQPETTTQTLAEYVVKRGYSRDFLDLYLIPMSSAVWSTPPEQMLRFPASTLLRFFHNHGFLGLNTQHPWWTVEGGSREYVTRLTAPWRHRIQVGVAATRIQRSADGVIITDSTGKISVFDQVIVATQGDEALRLLGDPRPDEHSVLGAFAYQANVATLHTDPSVMPRRRLAWASWNYEIQARKKGPQAPATHYWMNRLQGVSQRENYFVSINGAERIHPRHVIARIAYQHPLFDLGAVRAQEALPALNTSALGTTNTFFAGSYFRSGFHEDAFRSAVDLSTLLLGRDPWESRSSAQPAAATA